MDEQRVFVRRIVPATETMFMVPGGVVDTTFLVQDDGTDITQDDLTQIVVVDNS